MKPMTNDQIAQMVIILQDVDFYLGRFENHHSDEFKGRMCLCKTCYPSLGLSRPVSEIKNMADGFELERRRKVLFFKEIDFHVSVFFEGTTKAGIAAHVFANQNCVAYKEWGFDGFDEETNRFEFETLFKFICRNKSFRTV